MSFITHEGVKTFEGLKVVIAGSRKGVTKNDVDAAMADFLTLYGNIYKIQEVVYGTEDPRDQDYEIRIQCADILGKRWAEEHDYPIKLFKALWNSPQGLSAGPKRNSRMAKYGDALVAIWDGESIGTHDMIKKAINNNMIIFIYIIPKRRENEEQI